MYLRSSFIVQNKIIIHKRHCFRNALYSYTRSIHFPAPGDPTFAQPQPHILIPTMYPLFPPSPRLRADGLFGASYQQNAPAILQPFHPVSTLFDTNPKFKRTIIWTRR